jgi:hypothetical protein
MFEMSQPQEPREKEPPDYSALIIGAILLPVIIIFGSIGQFDMGLNIYVCLGVNILALKACWDLSHSFWFWVAGIVVSIIEIPLIMNIPWPNSWVPKVELLPIGLVGYGVMYGLLQLLKNFIIRPLPPTGED